MLFDFEILDLKVRDTKSKLLLFKNNNNLSLNFVRLHYKLDKPFTILEITEDGSVNAVPQILYGQYLILGIFGSCLF